MFPIDYWTTLKQRLGTSVDDTFVSSVVDEANLACGLDGLKYGCLDCSATENILEGRSFPSQKIAKNKLTNKLSRLKNELFFSSSLEKTLHVHMVL